MKYRTLAFSLFTLSLSCILLLLISCQEQKNTLDFMAMNTYMRIQIYSKADSKSQQKAQIILQDCKNEIQALENIISTTIPTSDIYKLNNSFDTPLQVNSCILELLNFSSKIYKKTEGAFNPALYPIIREWGFTSGDYKIPSQEKIAWLLQYTDFDKISFPFPNTSNNPQIQLPQNMQLDFGAIGKGYAGDKVLELLRQKGITSALLDFGGNIQTLGTKPDGSLWKVGIKNPWDSSVICSVSIDSKAVITSGGYERFFIGDDGKKYIHIFDSKTGYPCENDLESVTIVTPSGSYADALSTSLYVMGKEGAINFWKNNSDFDFILITKDQELIYSDGLKDFVKPLYDSLKVSLINR